MRYVAFFILVSVMVPGFGLAQVKVPDTLEEAKEQTLEIGDKVASELFGIIPNIWRNEVWPAWKAMWQWTQENVWQERLRPAWQDLVDRGRELLGQEVEKRAPIVEQQLEEEKQEIKEDVAQYGKSAGKSLPRVKAGLWQRFLDLFREE